MFGGWAEGGVRADELWRDPVENLLDGDRRKEAVDDDDVFVGQHPRLEVDQQASLRPEAEEHQVEVLLELQHPLVKTEAMRKIEFREFYPLKKN